MVIIGDLFLFVMIHILWSALIVITCLLIVTMVLLQNPRDEGGHGLSSSAGVLQLVDAGQLSDVLIRITKWLVVALFVLNLLLSLYFRRPSDHKERGASVASVTIPHIIPPKTESK